MTSKEKAVIAEHRQLARAIKAIERNLRKHKEQIVGLPGWGKAFRPLRKVFDGLLELKSTLDDELARETSRQVRALPQGPARNAGMETITMLGLTVLSAA